jgi:hypothetical protein
VPAHCRSTRPGPHRCRGYHVDLSGDPYSEAQFQDFLTTLARRATTIRRAASLRPRVSALTPTAGWVGGSAATVDDAQARNRIGARRQDYLRRHNS